MTEDRSTPTPVTGGTSGDAPTASWRPADAGTATTAVTSGRGNRNAARWGIALIVVAAVVGVAAAAFYLLGAPSEPGAYRYVPRSSVAVVEVRPELPGDQRQKLGNFLSHFPGFEDQATLDQKIDEALERLVREGSDGEVDYRSEVKPWLSGPMVLAFLEVPAEPAQDEAPAFVAILQPDASVTCASLKPSGSPTTERHRDVDLQVHEGEAGERFACGETDGLILAGDLASVKAALDAEANGDDITGTEGFVAAREAFGVDRVAFGYLDLRTLAREMEGARPDGMPGVGNDELPPWLGFVARLEDEALLVDVAAPNTIRDASPAPARSVPPDRVSALAPRLPASTVGVFEAHGLGIVVLNALDAAREDPETAAVLRDLEQAAALLGGVEGLVGWMGDASVVVTRDGDSIGGGLVVEATDESAAVARLNQIRGFLLLLGGTGIEVEEIPYAGTTITVLELGDLAGELAPGELPGDLEEGLSLAWAVDGGLFVLGLGDEFVRSVLDVGAGSSLADQAAYQRAMELAGATNSGQAFVDVAGLLGIVEDELDPSEVARYRADVRPYLEPLEGVAVAGRTSSDLIRGTLVITVR